MRDVVHVESEGSHWFIDQDHRTYVRTPKGEGPRWSPPGQDWGGPGAPEPVRDLEPHPYQEWWLNDIDQLMILVPGRPHPIRTPPGARVRSGQRVDGLTVNSDDDWLTWFRNVSGPVAPKGDRAAPVTDPDASDGDQDWLAAHPNANCGRLRADN